MGGDDWVDVRLTELGKKQAPVRVHEGAREFDFLTADATLHVTRAFDWERVLKNQAIGGQPLFEIAPDWRAEAETLGETPITAENVDQPVVAVFPKD